MNAGTDHDHASRPGVEAERGMAYPSRAGRWLVAAAALGTGAAFLDGLVVNLALPSIGRDLGGGFAVQQWVVDGYLLTLGALLLLGGSLVLASLACGLAPRRSLIVSAFRLRASC
jgi:hypothetical protein